MDKKEKVNLVYCENQKCPICGKSLIMKPSDRICPNKCYIISGGYDVVSFYVFGERFEMYMNDYDDAEYEKMQDDIMENKIVDRINYWKENERYLAELLGRMK